MESKSDLRLKLKERLKVLSPDLRAEKSQHISEKLLSLMVPIKAIHDSFVLGVYAPFGQEPIWDMAFGEAEFQTAYPALEIEQMLFKLSLKSELVKSSDFGVEINVPTKNALITVPKALIIPGLGFDRSGNRLGRGKGHYDRFLQNYEGLKIGVCFEEQLCKEVPSEVHDIKMDYVVTEMKIYRSNEGDLK